MFGYLLPVKPEMKVKEYECYRSVYCGLCKQLGREHGWLPRMFLNYDMVLVALLADGLAGRGGCPEMQRCMVNPARRCMLTRSEGLALAADSLVLSVWYKLADDAADERGARRLAAKTLLAMLKRAHRRAAARYPQLDAEFAAATAAQQALEAENAAGYDRAADPTARMTAAIFAECAAKPEQRALLARMGNFIGRVLYFLDAAEDCEEDKARGRYNVFLQNGLGGAEAAAEAKRQCGMAAAEAARCYNLLELKLNKPIWDNILFLGLPYSIQNAGRPRSKAARHPE